MLDFDDFSEFSNIAPLDCDMPPPELVTCERRLNTKDKNEKLFTDFPNFSEVVDFYLVNRIDF